MKLAHIIKMKCSGFRAKLILAFLVATLIPLIATAIISYRTSYKIAEDKILTSVLMSDEQVSAQVNDRIRQTENAADSVLYQMYSLNRTSDDRVSSLETISAARNAVFLYKSTFDFEHIFVFLQPDRIGAEEGLYFFSIDKLSDFNLTEEQLSLLGSSSLWLLRKEIPLPYMISLGKTSDASILCFRGLNNQGTGILEYAYCIALEADELSQRLRSYGTDEITSYILTPEGQITAHTDSSRNGLYLDKETLEKIKTNTESLFHSGHTYFHHTILNNGWIHVTEIPDSYIHSNTRVLIQTILLALFLFIPLTILIIIVFSRNLAGRLHELSKAMQSFRLEQNPEEMKIIAVPHGKDPDLYDEIDQLGLTFEDMEHTIIRNLKSIVDLSLNEERLKYQLLQSQINPHFLYNILGSIQTCQVLGRLDVSNQMITDLTAFYRLTLRKSSELISIRDELEIARLYLNIEKLCHRNQLNWRIEAEDGVENYMICRFTLQPFLENAILHGLSGSIASLFIAIQVNYGDDTVIITIRDNGAGISPETLSQLRYAMENKVVNYEKHFGISNVNARISSPLYGSGHVDIESEEGSGTLITIEFHTLSES